MDRETFPLTFVLVVLCLSIAPSLLDLAGASPSPAPAGGLVHGLLEWTAVCVSLFTAGLGFLYLRVRPDRLVGIIALAALVSGSWDGLHAVASLGIVETASGPDRFIPFTWAVSRTAKSVLLAAGVAWILLRSGRPPRPWTLHRFVAASVGGAGLTAVGFAALTAWDGVPRAYFPEALATRPWDLPALVVFGGSALFLYPSLVRLSGGVLAGAAMLSTAPDVLAQIHVSFLSTRLYDLDFHAAHGLKLLACLVPLVGLSVHFVQSFRREAELAARFERAASELRSVESELRRTEDRFTQLTDNIRQVFWLSNRDEISIEYVSPAYEELFGLSCESLYQDPASFLKAVHPQDRPFMERVFEERPRRPFEIDFRVLRESGEVRWLRSVAFPIRNEQGRIFRLAGLTEDVTEQREAQEAVRRSEARTRALFDAMPDLMFRLDRLGRIVDYHARDEGTLYRSPEFFLGRNVSEVLPEDMGREILEHVAESLEHRTMPVMEYRMRGRDGVERDFEARFVVSAENEVLAVVRDITVRKRLERELLEVSHREQQRIGHDLHDGLSQQLTGVALLLKVLQKKLDQRELPESADVRDIEALVEEAVSHTRILARGLAPVQLEAGGLSAALEEMADGVERLHPLRCEFHSEEGFDEPGESAAIQLYRIAQEAVINSLKHAGAQRIRIELAGSDGRLRLRVEDDGAGIGSKATASSTGGMGLHIMRYRARAIDATFDVRDAPERGTIVTCEWTAPSSDRRVGR